MPEAPNKTKHLEFVQLAITRMAANSFLLKAWSVTLVAALFALAANGSDGDYVLVAYLPVLAFWVLDSYYLHQERLFRALYDRVRVLSDDEIDYSMETVGLSKRAFPWLASAFSDTLIIFHGSMLVVVLVVMFVFN